VLFFIRIKLGPTVISDIGLITRVGFAALSKICTDNMSNIKKANPLLISYSNTPYELHHFAVEPSVFTAKQRRSKPSFIIIAATVIACARLIVTHLYRRWQRFTPNVPSRGVDRTHGLLVQRQTPLVAQPSRRLLT
jgi:hypothetical protein